MVWGAGDFVRRCPGPFPADRRCGIIRAYRTDLIGARTPDRRTVGFSPGSPCPTAAPPARTGEPCRFLPVRAAHARPPAGRRVPGAHFRCQRDARAPRQGAGCRGRIFGVKGTRAPPRQGAGCRGRIIGVNGARTSPGCEQGAGGALSASMERARPPAVSRVPGAHFRCQWDARAPGRDRGISPLSRGACFAGHSRLPDPTAR